MSKDFVTLTHVTLNTGDITRTSQDDVDRPAIERLRPLLRPGDHIVPTMPNWLLTLSAETRGYASFVCRMKYKDTPSAVEMICWDAAVSRASWNRLGMNMVSFRPALESILSWRNPDLDPPQVPWIAVGRTALIGLATITDLQALGDMERCMAWAILESPKK